MGSSYIIEPPLNKPEVHMTFSEELLRELIEGGEIRAEGPNEILVFRLEKVKYDL